MTRAKKRLPNGIYVDGVGLHESGLACFGRDGRQSTISLGDNNHSILVTDTAIEITTRLLTALSLVHSRVVGDVGRLHRIEVWSRVIGDGRFVTLHLIDDHRDHAVRLIFERVHTVEPMGMKALNAAPTGENG